MKTKVATCLKLIRRRWRGKLDNILVVGCGDGREALEIHNLTGAEVTGVDINSNFDGEIKKKVQLVGGDATALQFGDKNFDLVYCYHVLEHISNYEKALLEIERVLKDNGCFFIGVPNRRRLIGYIDSSVFLYTKLLWNMNDWKARLFGKFSNEKGAHAGFYEKELRSKLCGIFTKVLPVRNEYYMEKYSHKGNLVNLIRRLSLDDLVFPSSYFVCVKER